MQIKKKLALLLSFALLVSSMNITPVFAAESATVSSDADGNAGTQMQMTLSVPDTRETGSTTLNLKVPDTRETGSTTLTLKVPDTRETASTTLTLKVPDTRKTASTTLTIVIHDWQYQVEDNVLKVYCSGKDAGCQHGEDKDYALTLNAEDMKYSGEAYNKASITNTLPNAANATAGEITYYKVNQDGTLGEALSAAPTEIGEYQAQVVVNTSGKNATSKPLVKNFTITTEFAENSITAEDVEVTYDGNTYQIAVTGLPEDVDTTIMYRTENGTWSSDPVTFTNATEAPQKVYFKVSAPCYEDYIGSATVMVKPRPVVLSWSGANFTYTGKKQGVTATVTNKVGEDSFTLVYESAEATNAGTYTAKVTGLGNDNYTLTDGMKITYTWSINYLSVEEEPQIGGDKDEETGWYTEEVTIALPGYLISEDGEDDWKDEIVVSIDGTHTITYYLMDEEGHITDGKTITVMVDVSAPTGTIMIQENVFKTFLNNITFGIFCKDNVDVTIAGEDAASGVASIEYQKVTAEADYDADGNWITGTAFTASADDKFIVYARITDKVGKVTIINSEGVVVYKDATAADEVNFVYGEAADTTTNIDIGANTVKAITNGSVTLSAEDYAVEGSKIVLKASYLQTLAAGEYKLMVSYHSYGENDKRATSTITIKVAPKPITGAEVTLGDRLTANGEEQTQTVKSVMLDGEAVTFEVTDNVATKAGTYTLKIIGTGNFTGTIEQTFVIVDADKPSDEGQVTVEAEVEEGAPETTLETTKEDMMVLVMTADDAAAIADGAELDIWLEIKDASESISEESKTLIEAALEGYQVAECQYIDISLFKQLSTEEEKTKITNLSGKITIVIVIPEHLKNVNEKILREYVIVRNHNGVVELLIPVYDKEAGTLTFETDRFSDYAIAYKDTVVPVDDGNDDKPADVPVSPKTGDAFDYRTWLLLLMAGLAGTLGTTAWKKKAED